MHLFNGLVIIALILNTYINDKLTVQIHRLRTRAHIYYYVIDCNMSSASLFLWAWWSIWNISHDHDHLLTRLVCHEIENLYFLSGWYFQFRIFYLQPFLYFTNRKQWLRTCAEQSRSLNICGWYEIQKKGSKKLLNFKSVIYRK